MKRTPLAVSAVALCALAAFGSPGCKDDATVNEEPPLPGPGPIGMGGFTGATGGTAGAGGSTGGAGGAAGGMAGAGGTEAGGMGGTDAGGSGGTSAGGTSAGGAAGAGGGGAVCPMAGGTGKLRIGNMVPAAGKVDFCVKPAGGAFQGPLFSCNGGGDGLAYKAISKVLTLAAGTYDIKAVSGGDCSSAGIATASVAVDDKSTMTVLAFGGGATGEMGKVGVFKNDAPPNDGSINFRFVNGIHKGGGGLDVGLADGGTLPTNVNAVVFTNVLFGAVQPAGPGSLGFPVDTQGYAQQVAELPGTSVGAAKTGTTPAIFAATIDISPANSSITAYGVGILGDATFAPGAVICNDSMDSGMTNVCKSL
jgi:hypothetical protein